MCYNNWKAVEITGPNFATFGYFNGSYVFIKLEWLIEHQYGNVIFQGCGVPTAV